VLPGYIVLPIHSLFAPGPIRSQERISQYDWPIRSLAQMNISVAIRSLALSFLGTFAPLPGAKWSALLLPGTNVWF